MRARAQLAHAKVNYLSYIVPCICMVNLTVAVPDDMREEMRRHRTVKWPEVVRNAISAELERLHAFDKLLEESRLTADDAVELGREARRRAAETTRGS